MCSLRIVLRKEYWLRLPLPRAFCHGWKTFIGGHPIPTEASFIAGRAILERLARCDERTLIFFLVSGGGSALVEQALDPSVSSRKTSRN